VRQHCEDQPYDTSDKNADRRQFQTEHQAPRAVQRSIHEAHGEDCTDAAEGDAMPSI
jgi:hypothetical protein